jgi:hypothetical protein
VRNEKQKQRSKILEKIATFWWFEINFLHSAEAVEVVAVAEEERPEGACGKRRVADHPPHNSNLEPAAGDRIGAEQVPEAAEPAF